MVQRQKMTKGEKTRQRLLDAAEELFAAKGYELTSLRDVAGLAGIREPGIYNHFTNKQALYERVLERALQPLVDVIAETMLGDGGEPDLIALPGKISDLLCEHPAMPGLFHQALSSSGSAGREEDSMSEWLARLFEQGSALWAHFGVREQDRTRVTVRMVMLFNVVTGYFLAQKVFDHTGAGDLMSKENLAEQKRLLTKVMTLFSLER